MTERIQLGIFPQGYLGAEDKDRIPLWDREVNEYIHILFADSIDIRVRERKYSIYKNGKIVSESLIACPYPQNDFFAPNVQVLDCGVGGGNAVETLASWYPNTSFLGFDRQLTNQLIRSQSNIDNVKLISGNWESIPLPDGCIERVVSCFGPVFYAGMKSLQEIDRVSKTGTVLRGNYGEYSDRPDPIDYPSELSKQGWLVWTTPISGADGSLIAVKQ